MFTNIVTSADSMVQYVATSDAVKWLNTQKVKVTSSPFIPASFVWCSIANV